VHHLAIIMTNSTATTKDKFAVLRQRLLAWTAMTDQERSLAGEPRTVTDWCERNGASDRWVSKVRAREDFKAELTALQETRFVQSPVRPVVSPFSKESEKAEQSNAELFGEVVRNQLQAAAVGDKTALDFIKSANVSKPFVDALTAEFQTEFPDETDEELAEMFVDVFEDLCVAALQARGWSVER
jgi:hypothetical protein